MLPQRAVHKLGRHVQGLDNWPMVASYPQDCGEREFRQLVRNMEEMDKMEETKTMEGKKDTSVTLEINNKTFDDKEKNSNSFLDWLCTSVEEKEAQPADIDDVDGRAEEILKPLVRLIFMKTLLVDIGISVGDVLTDLTQGMNLVFDYNWNIQWTTFHYRLVVIGIVWLLVIPVFIHILTFKN